MRRGFSLLLSLAVGVAVPSAPWPAETALTPDDSSWTLPLPVSQGRNSVSGHVFGDSRQPLSDVHVELLSDLGQTVSRTRTNGSGRYAFFGIADGRYKVRVLPYAADYVEQTQDVSLLPLSAIPGSGAETQQLDFYLRPRAAANAGPLSAPGAVLFVQEVPAEAKRLFEKGIADLRAKREKEGFESLRGSLEIFPTYFAALDRLGNEYAVRGNLDKKYFEAARVLLTRAVEVNRKSFSSMFGLGFSLYHLGLIDQSIEYLKSATNLHNKMINGHLWLGLALKRAGKLAEAEVALKRADELSSGKEAEVHWHLAGLYGDQKRHKEAADELEKFLKNKPDARDAEKIRQVIGQLRQKAPTP